jgi:hypothetical protein
MYYPGELLVLSLSTQCSGAHLFQFFFRNHCIGIICIITELGFGVTFSACLASGT